MTAINTAPDDTELQPWQYGAALLLGLFFGAVLFKSEVVRWERINRMFRFEETHMYVIIGVAILVGGGSMLLIKRLEARSVTGQPIEPEYEPFQKGVVYGGFVFGIGWAITAACPGPIYAQIGAGEFAAVATLIGALGGMYLYGLLRPRLPH
jgi:uncharacterized membrane protein YedE/YeeE